MVDRSRIEILKKLENIKSLEKKDQQLFKKLAKKYPFFIPFKIINLILSKKYNNLDYDKNLEICATQISDRTYLYEIVQNGVLNENQKFEILKDLKEKSHDNKKSFIEWIKTAKPLTENEKLNSKPDILFNLFKEVSESKRKVKKIKKEDYMTQTLAELYIEQKKFKEALKAYEILSLKYPEKISLFANQINFLRKKLNNV
ncbi:MAG: hypothetical protein CBD95_002400 [Flavobacteriales bacterium TMED235]|nr:MAG: hypothetical protein CBD95_002400 [Flavobacteriales bacterium TMED235]|tara:strand:+ start:1480 stop:2082 length:603 start_codon:yes stop_codon:yes gene_type:complete